MGFWLATLQSVCQKSERVQFPIGENTQFVRSEGRIRLPGSQTSTAPGFPVVIGPKARANSCPFCEGWGNYCQEGWGWRIPEKFPMVDMWALFSGILGVSRLSKTAKALHRRGVAQMSHLLKTDSGR